jgi:hypothetical protein
MSRKKKTIIHINQKIIKSNKKTGKCEPVITVKTYDSNQYGHEAVIRDTNGIEIARVVYRPDKPLSCGATCWVESYENVEVIMPLESP